MKSVTSLSKRFRVSLTLLTALVALPLGSAFQSAQAKPKSGESAYGYRAKERKRDDKRARKQFKRDAKRYRNDDRYNRNNDENNNDENNNDNNYRRDRYNRDRYNTRNRDYTTRYRTRTNDAGERIRQYFRSYVR